MSRKSRKQKARQGGISRASVEARTAYRSRQRHDGATVRDGFAGVDGCLASDN